MAADGDAVQALRDREQATREALSRLQEHVQELQNKHARLRDEHKELVTRNGKNQARLEQLKSKLVRWGVSTGGLDMPHRRRHA